MRAFLNSLNATPKKEVETFGNALQWGAGSTATLSAPADPSPHPNGRHAFWYRIDANLTNNKCVFGHNTIENGIMFRPLGFAINTGSANATFDVTHEVGVWKMAYVVIRNPDCWLFIDGQYIGTAVIPGAADFFWQHIGRRGTLNQAADITIDHVFYDNNPPLTVDLQQSEANAVYNGGQYRDYQEALGTYGYWTLDLNNNGTDTTTPNKGSIGGSFTLNNFPPSGMWVAHN